MTKVTSMTPEGLKLRLSELGVTLAQAADTWGYTRQQASRWANGRAPIPAWVPYALGLEMMGVAPAQEPVEMPKPVTAPVVAKLVSKPAKPKAAPIDTSVPGRWRFGTFYPD